MGKQPSKQNVDDVVEQYLNMHINEASTDADIFLSVLDDVGLKLTSANLKELIIWMRRVLATLYATSRRRDADHSPELIRLALRFCLDPRKKLSGDWQDFRWERDQLGWTIHRQSKRGQAVLLPTIGKGKRIASPLSNYILDCVLLEPRRLSRLRNAVVRIFGGKPTPLDCIPKTRRPKFSFQIGDDDAVRLWIDGRDVLLPSHAEVRRLLCALCTMPERQITGKEAKADFAVGNPSRAVKKIRKALGTAYPEAAGWLTADPIGWVTGCAPKQRRGRPRG